MLLERASELLKRSQVLLVCTAELLNVMQRSQVLLERASELLKCSQVLLERASELLKRLLGIQNTCCSARRCCSSVLQSC